MIIKKICDLYGYFDNQTLVDVACKAVAWRPVKELQQQHIREWIAGQVSQMKTKVALMEDDYKCCTFIQGVYFETAPKRLQGGPDLPSSLSNVYRLSIFGAKPPSHGI